VPPWWDSACTSVSRTGAKADNRLALKKVALRVHLDLYQDETARFCHWHLPEAHYLEAWGDTRPTTAPLPSCKRSSSRCIKGGLRWSWFRR
jgi:anaerobic selenocysteine-containing dehydrogenase